MFSMSLQALEMVNRIRKSFTDLLNEVPWLDEENRAVAKEKVRNANVYFTKTSKTYESIHKQFSKDMSETWNCFTSLGSINPQEC